MYLAVLPAWTSTRLCTTTSGAHHMITRTQYIYLFNVHIRLLRHITTAEADLATLRTSVKVPQRFQGGMYAALAYILEGAAEGVSILSTRSIDLLLPPEQTHTQFHIVHRGREIKGHVCCGAVVRVEERAPTHLPPSCSAPAGKCNRSGDLRSESTQPQWSLNLEQHVVTTTNIPLHLGGRAGVCAATIRFDRDAGRWTPG